jgi:FkbM family methyltransferase
VSLLHKIYKNILSEPLLVNSKLINSYSQYGEDLVIDGIIGNKQNGFFIDIGANDPTTLNNTKRFYDRGWHGINIEPNPILFGRLTEQRPRDINLNIGLGSYNQKMPFYLVSADTLSSFNKSDARRNCRIFNERITGIIEIQIQTLESIFLEYVKFYKVDFLSIDVEGFELEVLQSNDWIKYRPYLILIEIYHNTGKIVSYLKEKRYEIIFNNSTNGIFLDVTGNR